jgi:plastocyanin
MRTAEQRDVRTFGWTGLVRAAAVVNALLFAGAAAALTDVEAGLFAVGMVVGTLLLGRRRGIIGRLGLALLFADTAIWMLPGAFGNLRHGEGFGATALPAALGITSVAGVVAVGGTFTGRGDRWARAVAVAAPVLLVAGLVVGGTTSTSAVTTRPGELEIVAKDVTFSPKTIEAGAGTIGVVVANRDLFWHTFTVRELRVNLKVPSIGERRTTFEAPSGTYAFVCAIPGHEQAGMKGTLVVR